MRGPSPDRLAPGTGPYGRPATKFCTSAGQLNAVVGTCVSDDVVEYSGGDITSTLVLSAGNAGWPQNVLIRPPLGQWREANGLFHLAGSHVTVAGFRGTNNLRPWAQSAPVLRSGFWRCKGSAFIGPRADNGHLADVFIVDFLSEGARLDGNDRGQGSTNSGGKLKLLLDGVYFGGAYRQTGTAAHTDTFQIQYGSGGGRIDLDCRNSVAFPSHNAAWFVNTGGSQGTMEFRNIWGARCSVQRWPEVPAGYECGGVYALGVAGTVLVEDSDIAGRLGSGESSTITALRSRIHSLGSGVTLLGDSVVDPNLSLPAPPVPNVDWMVAA